MKNDYDIKFEKYSKSLDILKFFLNKEELNSFEEKEFCRIIDFVEEVEAETFYKVKEVEDAVRSF